MRLVDALRLRSSTQEPAVVAFTGGGGKTSALFCLAAELTGRGLRVVTTTTTRIAVEQILLAPAHLRVAGEAVNVATLGQLLDRHGHCMLVSREPVDRRRKPGERPKAAGVDPSVVDRITALAAQLHIDAVLIEADGSRMLPAKAPSEHEPVVPASTTVLVPVLGIDAIGKAIDSASMHRPDRILSLLLSRQDVGIPRRLTPADAALLMTAPQGGLKGCPPGAAVVPMVNKIEHASQLAAARLIATAVNRRGYPCLLARLADRQEPVRERWEDWAVVILAAGSATRMGTPKQLVVWEGVTLVERAVRTALATDAARIIVVTGAAETAVARALAPLVEQHGPRLCLCRNAEWQAGQSTSVRCALAQFSQTARLADAGTDAGQLTTGALLFMPVDQPLLDSTLLNRLAQRWRTGAAMAAPLVDGGVRGAPSIFDRQLWPELLTLTGDVGGRQLLKKHPSLVASIPVDGTMLRDIDTPEDLRKLAEDFQ